MIHNSFLCFNGPDAHTGSVLAVHIEGCTQVLSVKSAQCTVSLTIRRLLWELEAHSRGRLVSDREAEEEEQGSTTINDMLMYSFLKAGINIHHMEFVLHQRNLTHF